MAKPNCYECAHRGDTIGSAHSCCNHPAYKTIVADPVLGLLAMLGRGSRGGPVSAPNGGITVKGNPHGINNGWFMHPLNFDPVWLEECSGFQSIAVSPAVSQAA